MTKKFPQSCYASFILRCWTDGQGQLRARLTEVDSGVSHPVASLETLPDLVRRLMIQVPYFESDPDVEVS
ncbi:MAG: hypothetical protein J7M16_02340 [Anaerolineae bacterium]|nr:hypothetical protein [Anaerolineae bacterium]